MNGNWLTVASADHAVIGRAGGFIQVCHGKGAPLRRIKPGNRVCIYSPSQRMGERDGFQSVTAIGTVKAGIPYQVDMGGGFHPWRRDVEWLDSSEVAIQPLLGQLELSRGNRNWGYQLRFGLIAISDHDMALIAQMMGVSFKPPSVAGSPQND